MNPAVRKHLNLFKKFHNKYYNKRYDDFNILIEIAKKYENDDEDILLFLEKFENQKQLKRELDCFYDPIGEINTFEDISLLMRQSCFEFENLDSEDYKIIAKKLNGEDLSEDELDIYYEDFVHIDHILANYEKLSDKIDFKGEYSLFNNLVHEYKRIKV